MLENKLEFTITGKPHPKSRPRFSQHKGRVAVYNAHKDISDLRKWQILSKVQPHNVIDAPIELDIIFYMPIPKGGTKQHKQNLAEGIVKHISKPDIDNLIKEILDNMNGIVYKDDSLIYKISSSKEYSKSPRTEVRLMW
jgi:Holliday junction resolvase RusA-like endonuclease